MSFGFDWETGICVIGTVAVHGCISVGDNRPRRDPIATVVPLFRLGRIAK